MVASITPVQHTQRPAATTARMSEEPSPAQPKPTPNRRRQGRNGGRNGAQKSYASENDAGLVNVSRPDTTPQTPDKNNHGNNSRQRPRTKSARKNNNNNVAASTSPEPDQPAMNSHYRNTPSRSVAPASVSNAIAYAGATFHASPAPSALPMPSFVSKGSVTPTESPASKAAVYGAHGHHQSFPQQPSPPATDTDVPTPQRRLTGLGASDSPLDFMFKAHREEKERQRYNGPSGQQQQQSAPPMTTPSSNESPSVLAGFHRGSMSMPHMRHHDPFARQAHHMGGIDDDELGRDYRQQPMGPAFSTPYRDRIKAARPSQSGRPGGQEQNSASPSSEDPSEALKRFLFGGNLQSSPAPAPGRHINHATLQRAPFPAVHQSPPTRAANQGPPPAHSASQGGNLQAMENDLRRILRLDAGPPSANTERRLFMH
ncbi:hypothetical protein GMORB2_3088 [Geosmithia morbida]|uniref:Proteophosphoglycan 5 n=1 Tax=Geosmithia morbida TaxID=1094350 RepID=A0A9P5CZB3_9HYPO|nr:uncharacterized protein GMORB2_3088 [Geosmithia morbida]KAF4120287.1 hypothetical protein GMORB2_3088 [Geosmithia morbida]